MYKRPYNLLTIVTKFPSSHTLKFIENLFDSSKNDNN